MALVKNREDDQISLISSSGVTPDMLNPYKEKYPALSDDMITKIYETAAQHKDISLDRISYLVHRHMEASHVTNPAFQKAVEQIKQASELRLELASKYSANRDKMLTTNKEDGSDGLIKALKKDNYKLASDIITRRYDEIRENRALEAEMEISAQKPVSLTADEDITKMSWKYDGKTVIPHFDNPEMIRLTVLETQNVPSRYTPEMMVDTTFATDIYVNLNPDNANVQMPFANTKEAEEYDKVRRDLIAEFQDAREEHLNNWLDENPMLDDTEYLHNKENRRFLRETDWQFKEDYNALDLDSGDPKHNARTDLFERYNAEYDAYKNAFMEKMSVELGVASSFEIHRVTLQGENGSTMGFTVQPFYIYPKTGEKQEAGEELTFTTREALNEFKSKFTNDFNKKFNIDPNDKTPYVDTLYFKARETEYELKKIDEEYNAKKKDLIYQYSLKRNKHIPKEEQDRQLDALKKEWFEKRAKHYKAWKKAYLKKQEEIFVNNPDTLAFRDELILRYKAEYEGKHVETYLLPKDKEAFDKLIAESKTNKEFKARYVVKPSRRTNEDGTVTVRVTIQDKVKDLSLTSLDNKLENMFAQEITRAEHNAQKIDVYKLNPTARILYDMTKDYMSKEHTSMPVTKDLINQISEVRSKGEVSSTIYSDLMESGMIKFNTKTHSLVIDETFVSRVYEPKERAAEREKMQGKVFPQVNVVHLEENREPQIFKSDNVSLMHAVAMYKNDVKELMSIQNIAQNRNEEKERSFVNSVNVTNVPTHNRTIYEFRLNKEDKEKLGIFTGHAFLRIQVEADGSTSIRRSTRTVEGRPIEYTPPLSADVFAKYGKGETEEENQKWGREIFAKYDKMAKEKMERYKKLINKYIPNDASYTVEQTTKTVEVARPERKSTGQGMKM